MTSRGMPQSAAGGTSAASAVSVTGGVPASASSPSAELEPNMDFIYHQTIIPTQAITHCVDGTFTLPGATDFVLARHDTLELWTLHADRNVTECVHTTRLFSNIYQIAAVPTMTAARSASAGGGGGILDSATLSASGNGAIQRLAVTSETGEMVLLRYELDEPPAPSRLLHDPSAASMDTETSAGGAASALLVHSLRGRFVRVSEVMLSRSGARLTAPGARLAVDPLGRAVFVTALMRLKVLVPLRKHEDYRPGQVDPTEGSMAVMRENEEDVLRAGEGVMGVATKRRVAVRDVISFGSPVEAHRQTLIFSVCALDGATENATFATLEQEIREETMKSQTEGTSQQQQQEKQTQGVTAFLRGPAAPRQGTGKQLVVYAFVAGLQQVQRTHLVSVPSTAHRLIPVPAAPFGPGGVLVCTDTELIWYDLLPQLHGGGILGNSYGNGTDRGEAPQLPGISALSLFKTAAPFPRREDFQGLFYDPMIISHATTCVRNDFFMLLQDDQGDVFRISLTLQDVQRSYDALHSMQKQSLKRNEKTPATVAAPSPLIVTYFDTIPPTRAMALFRRGFVFAASESAPSHGLYKIIKDGYSGDKEYILTRIRVLERGGAARHGDVDEEESKDPTNPVVSGNGDDNAAEKGNLMGPPSLPLASTSGAMRPPPPPPIGKRIQPRSRVVPLFLPHPSLRHMLLLESYPSTPPILSLAVHIHNAEHSGGNPEQQQKQLQQHQQHVQLDAVVGRGSDSVLLHARYGYAARLESTFTLPAVFTFLRPLASAAAMRQRWTEAQQESATTSSRYHRSRRSGNMSSRVGPVWDDKLLLSTRQGTTVLSLTLAGQVEPDTLSGFITAEHTIAAGALRHGVGYAQVTPSCILILPYHQDQISPPSAQQPVSMPVAEGMTWTHPHGKRILAGAVSGSTILVSFAQGGGIASFDMSPSGTRLQQLEMLPTFPHAPAMSLLYDPDTETAAPRGGLLASVGSTAILAAIATASQEVYIVNPKKLREHLETIRTSTEEQSGVGPAIVSVLLTYLGRTAGARRLFCFLGHMDGTVTRCELDTATYKVMDRAILTCGVSPCQMIPGDGERVCYILCGELNWRCNVQDGLAKTVPWRFPTPQAMYAAFRRPPPVLTAAAVSSSSSGNQNSPVVGAHTSSREELVLGVTGNTLSLFAAQQNGAETSALEYSFSHTALPVAGRRVMQHPTRSEYLIVIGTEHRGYGLTAIRQASAVGMDGIQSRGIHLDKPQRSLNHANRYTSTLQLYNRNADRLDPPVYFPEGEAVLSAAVGSFLKDFGKEPVVVTGCADQFTHGSGCGSEATWTQGRLRAYRFAVTAAMPGTTPILRLEFLHDTPLNTDSSATSVIRDYPSALHICAEVGLLFVGMGAESGLHVYGWGQRCFLRKRRLPNAPGRITSIETVFIAQPGSGTDVGNMGTSSTAVSSSYAADLFRCGHNSIARERRLLIVCGTVDQSIFVATVQPSGGDAGAASFLMIIARDTIPRAVTSIACLDERTYAVADRFGTIAFLRLPINTRFGFAEPVQQMSDVELLEAENFAAHEQLLQEVASHHTGQLVTSLRVHDFDPSGGTDASLAIRILFYATTLGAVGAYTPFVQEEDAALAAHVQPLIATHMRNPLLGGSGHPAYTIAGKLTAAPAVQPIHHVFEGDLAQLLLKASTVIFSTEAKAEVETELQRRERAEGAQRRVLGLPQRTLPALGELVAKQRALITLPQ